MNQQDTLYDFIRDYNASHGYGPSTKEMRSFLGVKSTSTAHFHLEKLRKEGRITIERGKMRTVRAVVDDPLAVHDPLYSSGPYRALREKLLGLEPAQVDHACRIFLGAF